MEALELADEEDYALVMRACRNMPGFTVCVGEVDTAAAETLKRSLSTRAQMRELLAVKAEAKQRTIELMHGMNDKDAMLVEARLLLGMSYAEAAAYAGYGTKSGAWKAERRILQETLETPACGTSKAKQ